jgi:CheY-like chemotaxis protein
MSIGGKGGRVLIADDKADIRTLLAQRLGLEPELEVVGEASSGAEAITKVGELKPAAIILDLQMPGMPGEEAIPILRSLAPELQILVFSAYVGVQKDLTGSWRPDAEIAKGGDLRVLVREVRRLLDELPSDLLELQLGRVEVGAGHLAASAWACLSPQLRDATPPGAATADLLALTGIFLNLGQRIGCASARGAACADLRVATRRAAAEGARRALAGLPAGIPCRLEPLYSALLRALPVL